MTRNDMRADKCERLVVIPTNPLSAYERKGLENLYDYYNPTHLFREVFVVSPLEQGVRFAHGMQVVGTTWRGVQKTLSDLKPQVVRAYGGYWASDLAVYNRLIDVPVVVSVHDAPPVWPHVSVRYADRVICMSQVVARAAVVRGVDSRRIRVMPNRVNLETFMPEAKRSSGLPGMPDMVDRKIILHVGRLEFQKNQETLINALKLLPNEYEAVFIGQGRKEQYCHQAQLAGVAQRCHWLDAVPNSQLPKWFSSCDCFCTPSRFEGFGVVFIEAAACGCPIVTSDISPMNEYLKHGVSAHLVKEFESPCVLASAIARVCEDAKYQEVLRRGARMAAERFDKRIVDRQEADIYLDVMGDRSRHIGHAEYLRVAGCFWRHRIKDMCLGAFWSVTAPLRKTIKKRVRALRDI